MEVTVTTKGQITLPKALRDTMHLKTGDKVIFELQEDGGYLLKPKTLPVQVLKDLISYEGKPVSVEDMDEAILQNMRG